MIDGSEKHICHLRSEPDTLLHEIFATLPQILNGIFFRHIPVNKPIFTTNTWTKSHYFL